MHLHCLKHLLSAIILVSHSILQIRHLLTLLHTALSELDGKVDSTSSQLLAGLAVTVIICSCRFELQVKMANMIVIDVRQESRTVWVSLSSCFAASS